MSRKMTETEKDARALMRKCRDLLQNQMDAYQDPDKFPVDSIVRAIYHSYSILARLEQELEKIPDDTDFEEELEEIEESVEYDDKDVTIPAKQYEKLQKEVRRANARVKRVDLLKELAKANRLLGQQMSEEQKIIEMRKRQKYIEIKTHAEVLSAYNDMIVLALRRLGLSELEMQEFFRHMDKLRQEYPLVKMTLEDVIEKLTASPEKRIELEPSAVEVMDDPEDIVSKVENTL
jgi:hypothetical protein